MQKLKGLVLLCFFWVIANISASAQCAMCRATLETNVSNGSETVLSANLNFGILYLFAAPYIIIAAVGYFWFRNSRKTKNNH
ncbi:MAG: hypothetical protein ABFS32_04875 [Bacteroidota bacterium]